MSPAPSKAATSAAGSLNALGARLCPWLRDPFSRLDAALRGGRLGHAWLIKGPPGIGKLNLAYAFAQRLLDGSGASEWPVLGPDEAVEAMRASRSSADHHPDLHRVFPEADKRAIGIEQIRALSETLSMRAYRGAAKAAVIEPAEAMTPAAANALLKTLEEPTEQTYLFLITHQPERLLPTIRSRCQSLAVSAPDEEVVREWLGIERADHPVMLVAGRSPLRAAELIQSDKSQFFSKLSEQVEGISKSRVDPRDVAEQWTRQDTDLALEWLIGRIERAIRVRAAHGPDSKAVTSARSDSLHNAWLALPLRALFERRDAAQRLFDRLGSGINVELALHGLLLGFRTERG
jgi:DNA polymerase-3 subunit delta'